MKIKNKNILEYAQKLSVFNDSTVKMPIRINFYLQRNINLIQEMATEIKENRKIIFQQLGEKYGVDILIPMDKAKDVKNELNDLLNLEQDLNIHIFKLDDFDGIELEFQQLSAIMFMIEE